MKYLISTVFAALFAILLQAQDSTSYHVLALKFSPLAYFNIQTPCLQPGVELGLNPNWSIGVEYGYQCNQIAPFDLSGERKNWKYHKLRTELRYYISVDKHIQSFLSLEYFEVRQRYTKFNGHIEKENGTWFRYDQSDIRRDTRGGLAKIGLKMTSTKHFFLEIIGGIGAKGVAISHDLTNPTMDFFEQDDFYFPRRDEQEGTWALPIMSLEIKLGYALFRSKK